MLQYILQYMLQQYALQYMLNIFYNICYNNIRYDNKNKMTAEITVTEDKYGFRQAKTCTEQIVIRRAVTKSCRFKITQKTCDRHNRSKVGSLLCVLTYCTVSEWQQVHCTLTGTTAVKYGVCGVF